MNKKASTPQELLRFEEKLRHLLKERKVWNWQVLHMSSERTHPIALTPEIMEEAYHFKWENRLITSTKCYDLNSFLAALPRTTAIVSTVKDFDVAYALLFSDQNDKRLLSLYVDRSEYLAEIDGKVVEFKGELELWLRDFAKRHFGS
ncbi:MAG: hypothetical protein EOP06_29595 [Proteobacteria bacterium]|nr:MAG: hypothetical protein EOP06_29595 [Pseudomonadota bacterium]